MFFKRKGVVPVLTQREPLGSWPLPLHHLLADTPCPPPPRAEKARARDHQGHDEVSLDVLGEHIMLARIRESAAHKEYMLDVREEAAGLCAKGTARMSRETWECAVAAARALEDLQRAIHARIGG